MTLEILLPILVSVLTIGWTIYRDKTSDADSINDSINELSTKTLLSEQRIAMLEHDSNDLEIKFSKLQSRIEDIDRNITRILTLLERDKNN